MTCHAEPRVPESAAVVAAAAGGAFAAFGLSQER
jgi:hypothetical protein